MFFLRHIVLGAKTRHFSELFLQPFHQLMLVKSCCRAILRNAPFLRRRIPGNRFLVAELEGKAVGAALTETELHGAGGYSVLLAYLVVDTSARRQGVATELVRRIIIDAPAPSRILCACAPASKGMMKLLARLDFKRRGRAVELPGLIAPSLFHFRKAASMPAGALATRADRKIAPSSGLHSTQ